MKNKMTTVPVDHKARRHLRRPAAMLLAVLLLALCMTAVLTGCDSPAVTVRSVLNIDDSFSGSRTVTVIYPLSADIDAVKDAILADDPAAGVEGADFRYIGVEEDGYHFELSLRFDDRDAYEGMVGAVIGRPANAFLSRKNTALTKGTRMAEDFDVRDLIAWMVRDTAADSATRDLRFDYSGNTVVIGSETFSTGSTASVNDCTGSTVSAISIKTANNKDNHYSRTFTFSIPNDTYLGNKAKIEQYFLTNTAPAAGYYGWSAEGTNMLYTVIFDDISLSDMVNYTSMLLDTDSVDIFYGDRDNSSTPLSEGLTFEESLDTFSFIGPDNGAPALEYSYSLPTSTIHGDGSVFEEGRWVGKGAWEDGVYKVSLDAGSARLRIPDGIQYAINGINFRLTALGERRFCRETDFLYSKSDGHDGMVYAEDFFAARGADVATSEDDDDLICTVTCTGTADEITKELVRYFGSGNFMAYQQSEGALSLSVKTSLTDYINLSEMLNASNANRPMTYSVSSKGGDHIVSLSVDGTEIAYTERGDSVLPITGGVGTVEYRGNIPITAHIVIYTVIGVVLLCLTVLIAVLLLKPKKRKLSPAAQELVDEIAPEDGDDKPSPATMQTTTFSIAELGALSRNKEYVDEINKDIEERLHAESLQDQKKELRARELEEMSRKVYGSADEQAVDEPAEENEDE